MLCIEPYVLLLACAEVDFQIISVSNKSLPKTSSRIRRIARGSGRSEKDVKELFSQYASMKKMMKSMKRQKSKFMRRLPVQ